MNSILEMLFGPPKPYGRFVEPPPLPVVEEEWNLWEMAVWPGYPSPYQHERVEIRRRGEEASVVRVADLSPQFNVAHLWWRPVKK